MIRPIRLLPLLACGALILESGAPWAQTATRRRAAKAEDSFPRLGVEPPPSPTFPPVRPEDAEPASSPAVATPSMPDAVAPSAIPATVDPLHGGAIMEPTEFVDQDIRDVLRAVARAYNLNIFPHPEVKGRVTVTLHRIPVIDALRNIAQLLGYELSWDGNAYYVAPPRVKSSGSIRVAEKTITISIESQDVRKFADDFARRTGLNLLVDRNAKGTVTGMLRDVDPVDGLRALLSANGFAMRPQGDILVIESDGAGEDPNRMGGGGFNGGMMGRGRLDLQVRRGLVTATLRNAQLSDVVRQLADQSGLNMITYGQIGGVVDANLRDVPIDRAMTMILQGTPFTYVLKDSVIMIGDRNPGSASGQALSSTEIVYLKHARVDKLLSLLPKNLPAQGLQPVPELNALMLSGTSEQNQKVREFLDLIDREVPQVVIEAVVVEFNRGKNLEYGLKQAPYAKTDSALTGPILGFNTRLAGRVPDTLSLGGFELGAIGLLPQSFQLQLSAMENSSLGKVLARPRITTLNGQPANINVGQTDYFQVVTPGRDINSIPTIDYRAFNSGINLSITPYVTESGFITAELKPEVRTPTSAGGSGANAPPATSTRSISTNVRLKDGETLVLGGLIQTLDLSGSTGVPLLSAIPFIGKLFTYRTKQKTTTELVIFITPRIIRGGGGMVDINDEIERLQRKYEPYSLNRIFGDRDFEVAANPESARKGKLVQVAHPDSARGPAPDSPASSPDTAHRAVPASLTAPLDSPRDAAARTDAPVAPTPIQVPQAAPGGGAESATPATRGQPATSSSETGAPANVAPAGAPRLGAPRGRVVRPTPIGPPPARTSGSTRSEPMRAPVPLSPPAGVPTDSAPSP